MKGMARTLALPPLIKLLPRHLQDCRVNRARPASKAICLAMRLPSSGNSASGNEMALATRHARADSTDRDLEDHAYGARQVAVERIGPVRLI